ALREFPEVQDLYTTINTGSAQGRNYATTFVRLTPRAERARTSLELSVPVRARLQRIAGIEVTHIGSLDGVGGDNKQIRLSLLGPDLEQLARLSEQAQERMRAIAGVVDLDSSLKAEKPTIAIQAKRDIGADLGIGVAQIGNALRPLLAGEAASSWRAPDDENYDVSVLLAPELRTDINSLGRLMLASSHTGADGAPRMVALRQVAAVVPAFGANQINRRNLNREVELSANVVGRASGQVGADVQAALNTLAWQPGYRYE